MEMTRSDLDLLGDVGAEGYSSHRTATESHRARSLAALAVVMLLLAGLAGGVYYGGSRALSSLHHSTPDFPGSGSGAVNVVVHQGDTSTDIAGQLLSKGVVKSTAAFVTAADANARSRSLQPGTYQLRKQMKASLALALLLDPASKLQKVVTLPEGFSVNQSLARIAAKTGLPLAQLTAAARATGSLGLPAYAKGRLEGFLYPATYTLQPGITATAVLRTMVAKFNAVAAADQLQTRSATVQMTPYQVLTIASLVQEEGLVESDMPKIARVIYNRLANGTPLGIDASIFYGLGRARRLTGPATRRTKTAAAPACPPPRSTLPARRRSKPRSARRPATGSTTSSRTSRAISSSPTTTTSS